MVCVESKEVGMQLIASNKQVLGTDSREYKIVCSTKKVLMYSNKIVWYEEKERMMKEKDEE